MGMPAFRQVLEALTEAWQRPAATTYAGWPRTCARTCSARWWAARRPADPSPSTPPCWRPRWRALRTDFDAGARRVRRGPEVPALDGAGVPAAARPRAPATRMPGRWSTRRARRWPGAGSTTSSAAASRATRVDRQWVVPHFEKMLYDNAQLLGRLRPGGADRRPLGERVAAETADFLVRELGTAEGGLRLRAGRRLRGRGGPLLRLDAGAAARGARRARTAAWAAALLEVTDRGHLRARRVDAPAAARPGRPGDDGRWADLRGRLLAARAERVRPARDDKVVAAWNGLAIVSLVDAGRLLGREDLVAAALRAGTLLADLHLRPDGSLLRVSRDGVAGRHRGVLEDHGCVAHAFLALAGATGEAAWLERARSVLDHALERFRRRGRRVLRHRLRRRGAGRPAAGPLRQRQPLGHVGDGARPAGRDRAHGARAATGRRRTRRCPPSRP